MTLLDFYGAEAQDPNQYWSGGATGVTTGRSLAGGGAGKAFTVTSSTAAARRFTASSHVFVGIAMTAATVDGTNRAYFVLSGDTGATPHLMVAINNTTLTLYRGLAATVIASVPLVSTANTFRYFEIEATIADTGGIANVRVDGTQVITYTGDTRNFGTNLTVDTVSCHQNFYVAAYDDFYVCNDQGSVNNTWLGDVRVGRCAPDGAGTYTQLTPDTGANWSRVNEAPPSAANYVSSSTSGQKDTYSMGDLPTSSVDVLGVRAGVIAKNPDGGTASARTIVRTGGTDYVGTTTLLTATDALLSTVYQTNPATSALWTPAEVNGIEVGVERI